MKQFKIKPLFTVLITTLALSACGGGGSSNTTTPNTDTPTPPPTPVNVAPTAGVSHQAAYPSLAEVSLHGWAEDSDGTITSYQWTQTAGPEVTLAGVDTATLSFTAPQVDFYDTLSFDFTVTDDKGDSFIHNTTLTVSQTIDQLAIDDFQHNYLTDCQGSNHPYLIIDITELKDCSFHLEGAMVPYDILNRLPNLKSLELYFYFSAEFSEVEQLDKLIGSPSLTKLSVRGILDQTDIDHINQIDTLEHFSFNVIENNLALIPQLSNIISLRINHPEQAINLEAIGQMTQLQTLDLNIYQSTTGLQVLTDLTNLTKLDLGGNYTEILTKLPVLPQITELDLSDSVITDISPLTEKTPNVIKINNWFSRVTNYHSLKSLSSLRELYMFVDDSVDLNDIAQLSQLEALDVTGDMEMSDISAIANLTNLKYLELVFGKVTDLSPLSNLTQLKHLAVSAQQLTDVSPLSDLTQLEYLRLSNNNLVDISPLASLVNLTELKVNSNTVEDISAISNMSQLTTLYLGYNNIADISSLTELSQLQKLDLSNNRITDITPLLGKFDLTHLRLLGNPVENWQILEQLPNRFGFDQHSYPKFP